VTKNPVKARRNISHNFETDCARAGVTKVVPAGTSSPARTMQVARGPVIKITLA